MDCFQDLVRKHFLGCHYDHHSHGRGRLFSLVKLECGRKVTLVLRSNSLKCDIDLVFDLGTTGASVLGSQLNQVLKSAGMNALSSADPVPDTGCYPYSRELRSTRHRESVCGEVSTAR